MKMRHKFVMALITLLFIYGSFAVSTAKADSLSEEAPVFWKEESPFEEAPILWKVENLPDEEPMFCAKIEYSSQGYIVKGTFTDFPSDIISAEVLYSLDGEVYQTSGEEWNITKWSGDHWTNWNEVEQEKFQNQTCLHSNTEPLKSYLAGKLDRFYVKLRLTRETGIVYETQAAVIERGSPGPVPEEMTPIAQFAPSVRVQTYRPFSYYARYQITVSEDATPEEIAAFLPDTLPVRIELQKGIDCIADGIIDCPVTWKPLSFLKLTAGESVTIPDAAEEIVIPSGTMLNTPLGVFQLHESLGINQYNLTDEVRLVLNVVAKGESPTGALACENDGIQMVFYQKPTGATAIRAYTIQENKTKWIELSDLPLLQAINAQPSTASSGYTYVLRNDQEPYRSYLAAEAEERNPSSFFIGLQIEGGVYDGRKLILAWPNTYELPLNLPDFGGSGGNEDNAGTDNKGDGTAEGQRPNLPHVSEIEKEGWRPDIPENFKNKNTALPDGNSSYENLQNQISIRGVSRSNTSAQMPETMRDMADLHAEERNSTANSLVHKGAGSRTETKTPHFVQNSKSAAPISSGGEAVFEFHIGNSRREFLLLVLTSAIAVSCMIGICIVTVADNSSADKKS